MTCWDERASMIQQYQQECMQANAERGLDTEQAKVLCACEAGVIEAHFSTFVKMVTEGGDESTGQPSDAEVREVRKGFRQCQQKDE